MLTVFAFIWVLNKRQNLANFSPVLLNSLLICSPIQIIFLGSLSASLGCAVAQVIQPLISRSYIQLGLLHSIIVNRVTPFRPNALMSSLSKVSISLIFSVKGHKALNIFCLNVHFLYLSSPL